MDQFKKLWMSLPVRQRWVIVILVALVGAGIAGISHWQRENSFRPLYTSLAQEDAAAIVQKLKTSGVEYRLSEGGSTVLVRGDRIAELRLEMAGAGLPKSGRIGFELFDKTNFGATDFTEHVNYRRALEGELERSVMSMNEVEQARVHVTFAKESVFLESRQPAKASVLVKVRAGAKLPASSVLAITHLVSSAVEGLSPDAVSVLDMRGNLLIRAKKQPAIDGNEPSEAVLEYQQQIERGLAAKVALTLEPLLGADKFRVAVSVENDFTSGDHSEETFDPSQSVMLSSQKIEDSSAAGTAAAGTPGTASNLPRPTSGPGRGANGYARKTENVAYQSSRKVRRTKLPQGALKRVSATVLVDQEVRWEGKPGKLQRVLVPPSAEKMKVIRDLVAGIVGFKQDRGDQLVVETMPFETTLTAEPPGEAAPHTAPPPPASSWSLDTIRQQPRLMAIAAGAGAVLLALAVFVYLRVRRRAKAKSRSSVDAAASQLSQPSPAAAVAEPGNTASPLSLPPTQTSDRLVTLLRVEAPKDAEGYSRVIQDWLTEEQVS